MQLSIIIVNYNVKYFLEQCLFSVQAACKNISAEIWVVDNCSTDGSRPFLEQRFSTINFIWNSNNEGFAKANNRALTKSSGKYILFLNPDTIIPEDCFEKCIDFLETTQPIGGLGIRMIDGSGNFLKESKRAFPSPIISLYKLLGLSSLFPRSKNFAQYNLGHLSEHENHEVDVLAGAFMILPKKVLDEIGGFDETFFMYGEDVDLSFRIQKAGYKNYYFSESTIIHFKGESTKKGSLNYVKMFYKAMSQFVKKHHSGKKAGLFNFFVQIAIVLRGAASLIGNFFRHISIALLDACIISISFWSALFLWSNYIRKDVYYSTHLLIIAFPIFTLLFLITAYYTGLYDKRYKSSRLNQSALIAALVLLSVYGLLPENIRFSRGMLVSGIFIAFIGMHTTRWLLIKAAFIQPKKDNNEYRQTIVLSDEYEFNRIATLMDKAGLSNRLLGCIHDGKAGPNTIGNIQQLHSLIATYPIKEIIFCKNSISYKEIIAFMQTVPKHIRLKFHTANSNSIIGSDNKDIGGDSISTEKKFALSTAKSRRLKNLFDFTIALFFIITFPAHIFLQKKPLKFLKNTLSVLLLKKTWIGYASENNDLPSLKKGVLTTTAMPKKLNHLPDNLLIIGDEWYASEFSVATDVKKLRSGYKYLSY